MPPFGGDVERILGGVVSGGGAAVSKDHTRQSQNPGGPTSQGSPPTPFRFWSRRVPDGARAGGSNRTVYRVPGLKGSAGADKGGVWASSWIHDPCVYTRG